MSVIQFSGCMAISNNYHYRLTQGHRVTRYAPSVPSVPSVSSVPSVPSRLPSKSLSLRSPVFLRTLSENPFMYDLVEEKEEVSFRNKDCIKNIDSLIQTARASEQECRLCNHQTHFRD